MDNTIAPKAHNVDDLIFEHAERLQRVYDNRTAGSHTFIGALAIFLMDYQAMMG